MSQSADKKEGRYARLYEQLIPLMDKTPVPLARMATIIAILHHKMDSFFWTGFYLLNGEDLVVGPYQGSLACQVLERHKGVCWAAIDRNEPVIVADVHQFDGHIACDSRSQSEIALPLLNQEGRVVGVFDIDSKELGCFDGVDALWLKKIVALVYAA